MEETKGRKEPCSTFNAGHTKDKSTSKLWTKVKGILNIFLSWAVVTKYWKLGRSKQYIYFLAVQEVVILKSRFLQCLFLLEALSKNLIHASPQLLVDAISSRCSLVCRHISPISAPSSHSVFFSMPHLYIFT
jgi:hypothetical protein